MQVFIIKYIVCKQYIVFLKAFFINKFFFIKSKIIFSYLPYKILDLRVFSTNSDINLFIKLDLICVMHVIFVKNYSGLIGFGFFIWTNTDTFKTPYNLRTNMQKEKHWVAIATG